LKKKTKKTSGDRCALLWTRGRMRQ